MRELYVYYRVALADVRAVEQDVRALQNDLRAHRPGLHARLLKRPEAADGRETWMEVYALPSDRAGVSAELQAHIESRAAATLRHLDGPRHVEVFLACAS